MNWKKFLAPAVIAAVVTLGGASVAGASNIGGFGGVSQFAAQDVTETATATTTATTTATATATTTATATSTPGPWVESADEACAGTLTNSALAILCPLWNAGTLQERQQEMLERLIVRIANVGAEKPHDDDDDDDDDRHHRGEMTRAEKLRADCEKYVEKHPEHDNPHAVFCQRVLAEATATATATATGTSTASASFMEQLRHDAETRHDNSGKERGRSSRAGGKQ